MTLGCAYFNVRVKNAISCIDRMRGAVPLPSTIPSLNKLEKSELREFLVASPIGEEVLTLTVRPIVPLVGAI